MSDVAEPHYGASDAEWRTALRTTRRNWKWGAAACLAVGFFFGRNSAPDDGAARADLDRQEELSRATNSEFYDLWNEYADFADDVGRHSWAEEVRLRYEPRPEDFYEYPSEGDLYDDSDDDGIEYP